MHLRRLKYLIESEEMASHDGMAPGTAHEVNTPAGIALTSNSSLLGKTLSALEAFKAGDLTENKFSKYLHHKKTLTRHPR
jgi:hypothetical protein